MTTALNDLFEWGKNLTKVLFLSFTSPKFYTDNFKNYTGYGVKYLLTISIICSLLVSIVILNATHTLNEYFSKGVISKKVMILDHIINQFPVLEYDGKQINITSEDTPITLNNTANETMVIIDPENKTPYSQKAKVPFYMGANKIILTLMSAEGEVIKSFPLKYESVFGNEKLTINQDFIKASLAHLTEVAPNIIIFIVFPVLSVLIFSNAVLQNVISILVISCLFYFYQSKMYLQNCIRVVFFSSGVTLLFQVIISILSPSMVSGVWILELWVNFLVVAGLFRVLSVKKHK